MLISSGPNFQLELSIPNTRIEDVPTTPSKANTEPRTPERGSTQLVTKRIRVEQSYRTPETKRKYYISLLYNLNVPKPSQESSPSPESAVLLGSIQSTDFHGGPKTTPLTTIYLRIKKTNP